MAEVHAQRILVAESRAALLDALAGAEHPLSVEEAAARLGLHPSTTRFHLDLLVSAGFVERRSEKRNSAGRPRIRYSVRAAEPQPVAPAPAPPTDGEGYRHLASVLADQLSETDDPARAAREAGRRWNAADDLALDDRPLDADSAIDVVADLMNRLGFAPEVPARRDEIVLRRCPFEEVAREHRDVVCGVHAGLLERAFERLGGAVEVARLEPFATEDPLLCRVRLRRPGGKRAGSGARVGRNPSTPVPGASHRRGGAARAPSRRPA